MGENTIMPLNQPPISWHPVAPARYLALVLAGRPKYSAAGAGPGHRARWLSDHGGHANVADVSLFRTNQTAGMWETGSERLSNCDQTTHEGIVSLE
jgi:hypothetical protein